MLCSELDYEDMVTFGVGQTSASVALPLPAGGGPDSFSAVLSASQPAVITGQGYLTTVTVLRDERGV